MRDPGPPPVAALAVVVPAHDEEALLGRCLTAIADAAGRLSRHRPDLVVTTLVVLDRCRDGTAGVAAAVGAPTLEVDAGSVGVARRAGVRSAVAALSSVRSEQVWVACTDADSAVPPGWLLAQVAAADHGASLVLGPVRPDARDLDPATHAAWLQRHRARRGDVVHGANLGFRLDAYRRAGGFPPVAEHEDVLLVGALRGLGVAEGAAPPVATSGRRVGRTAGGFAGYLRALEAELIDDVAVRDEGA